MSPYRDTYAAIALRNPLLPSTHWRRFKCWWGACHFKVLVDHEVRRKEMMRCRKWELLEKHRKRMGYLGCEAYCHYCGRRFTDIDTGLGQQITVTGQMWYDKEESDFRTIFELAHDNHFEYIKAPDDGPTSLRHAHLLRAGEGVHRWPVEDGD